MSKKKQKPVEKPQEESFTDSFVDSDERVTKPTKSDFIESYNKTVYDEPIKPDKRDND